MVGDLAMASASASLITVVGVLLRCRTEKTCTTFLLAVSMLKPWAQVQDFPDSLPSPCPGLELQIPSAYHHVATGHGQNGRKRRESAVVMAKPASPVRLQDELMRSAALAGARHQRSAAQQIEYWAALGRELATILDPDQVFTALEQDRRSGALVDAVSASAVRYQACSDRPGYLERIDRQGQRSVGRFVAGRFRPGPADGR